jgi:multicomponent Na+:H+ antiporter subunit F
VIYTGAFLIVFISIILTLIRLVKGPDGVDRILSIDLLTTLLACLMILYILKSGELLFLDTPLVLTMIAFFGTLMYSRYLERRIKK